MTVPVWMLFGFATRTVLLSLATVGVYCWSRILTGRVAMFFSVQIVSFLWLIGILLT